MIYIEWYIYIDRVIYIETLYIIHIIHQNRRIRSLSTGPVSPTKTNYDKWIKREHVKINETYSRRIIYKSSVFILQDQDGGDELSRNITHPVYKRNSKSRDCDFIPIITDQLY